MTTAGDDRITVWGPWTKPAPPCKVSIRPWLTAWSASCACGQWRPRIAARNLFGLFPSSDAAVAAAKTHLQQMDAARVTARAR